MTKRALKLIGQTFYIAAMLSLPATVFADQAVPLTFTSCAKVDVTSLHALSAPTNNSMYAALTVTAADMFGWQSAQILWVADNGKAWAVSNESIGKAGATYALPKKINNSPIGKAYLINAVPLMYTVYFYGFGERNNYGNTPFYQQSVQEGQSVDWSLVPADNETIGIGETWTLYGWMMQSNGNPYYMFANPDAKVVVGDVNLIPFSLPN